MRALAVRDMPAANFDTAGLLDTLSTSVVVLDSNLKLIYANVSAQHLMAMSARQTQGRAFTDLFHDATELTAVLLRSLQNKEVCMEHELTLKVVSASASREATVVDLVVTPLDEIASGARLLVELVNATQRQRISRDSDILSGMEGSRSMVRQLAHEVKNPLGGLRGAAQLLDRELPDANLREYTAVIISEADRLTALVDSMAGSSRPPQLETLNVHEVTEHVLRLIRAEAPPGIQVNRDYDPSLPEGLLDRHQLIQALLNVARNAMQAVGEQGIVTMRTRARSNCGIGRERHRLVAAIEVEDNGPGVPPALMKSLFLPLVTGRKQGTGLGLAVAQDLVTRHGGIIEFTSHPGQTIFSLLLPLEGKSHE